jgi:hypothetical protein
MPTIAIIDDRKDHHITAKRLIDAGVLGDWDSKLGLYGLEEYPSWLIENGGCYIAGRKA